ncbi:MAG: fused response regulator/phosphatase [Phycisphaeraceae bacterium]|nr:fused response regulator/phosphatase [Phycisphaeraceae bacterium]
MPVPNETARCRVLLVDDQPIIGEAVRRMLSAQPDFEFEYCRDPHQAIDRAIAIRPTVILQDLVMPEVDGLDLVKAYREREETREIPLVVLSSKEEAATKADAFARGANDYLVKLPDALEVLARLRYHSRGYIAQLERNAAYKALDESRAMLMEEVRRAAEYVQSLLPAPLEGPISTQWRFIPSESLGGDCFGYHWIDDERLAIYLLDVCGHGVGPALLAVSAMNMIRGASMPGATPEDPASVLRGLNELFPMTRHNGMFFTLFYGVYERPSRTLRWSNAGHPPALVVAPDGAARRLDSQGLMIGAVDEMTWSAVETVIEPGARLLIYSDGLYELRMSDGSMWSLDDFLVGAATAEHESGNAHALDAILARSRAIQRRDDFSDDASLLEVTFRT